MNRVSFFGNVVWNWIGIGASLFAAFIVSPLVVRRLGDENYGLWAITAALVEYYWLLDFGLRSATIWFTAHYAATAEHHRLNEILSTATAYNLVLLPLLAGGTWLGREALARAMGTENPVFPALLMVVAVSWSLTSLFSTFTACLEGLQRFDLVNQVAVVCTVLRAAAVVTLLQLGYGVLALAYVTMGAQLLLHVGSLMRLRSVFPDFRLQLSGVRWPVLRSMLAYGKHSVASSLGQRVVSQSPPLIIAYLLPERFAGYFTNPRQLLDYAVEGVARIGNVSNSRTAELFASGRLEELRSFSVTVNRISLALFLPLAIFLSLYGRAFLLLWLKEPLFVEQAAPVLHALLAGHTLATAGQYSSTSILFGMARHRFLARTLMVEAVLVLVGVWFVVPRWGIAAAAWWLSFLLIVNRALLIPWLLTRELRMPFLSFLAGVNRPLLAVPPAMAGLFWLRSVMPGETWFQLILAGAATLLLYTPVAYWLAPAADKAFLHKRLRSLRS